MVKHLNSNYWCPAATGTAEAGESRETDLQRASLLNSLGLLSKEQGELDAAEVVASGLVLAD